MDFRLNVPPQPDGLKELLAAALCRVTERGDFGDRLSYGSTAGRDDDREAGSGWLKPRLPGVSAEDVVVCSGGASLLAALVTTFTSPGETILAEELTYPGIRAVCRHFGRNLVGVEMDGEGLLPGALFDVCRKTSPRVLYCSPTIQNPTTATMSADRRRQIVEVCEKFGLLIFEDDAYGMLPAMAPQPLAAIAPDRTFYMASLSKCITPGLRIAYCVGPQHLKAKMTEGVRVLTFLASQIMAGTATQLIDDGTARTIIDSIRAECSARQAMAAEILLEYNLAAHPEGPHIWVALPGEWKIEQLGEYLRSKGVTAKGDGFSVTDQCPGALRIGLGTPPTRSDLANGLDVVAHTLRSGQFQFDRPSPFK